MFQGLTKHEHELIPTQHTSVQPCVLLRTSIFSPRSKRKVLESVDLSEALHDLSLVKTEGYDEIKSIGPALNVVTDWKIWCGVILAFSKLGFDTDTISMKFTDFARQCNYPSKRMDRKLRDLIVGALERIQNTNLTFKRKNGEKAVHTSLLLRAAYDVENDTIELMADKSLHDLFAFDYTVLVSLKVIDLLPRNEVAQALYLYLVALPNNPVPISFERFRERLDSPMEVKEVNRMIRKALTLLESIGFIKGSILKKGREAYYVVHRRNKKLT